MNKLKLLIAVDTYYPKTDGTLRFVEEFVKRIRGDFDYHILAPNYGGKKDSHVTKLSISKIVKNSGYASIKISLENIRKIKKAVRESQIVFVQGPALISFFCTFYCKRYKKKCVGYAHVDIWEFFEKFLTNVPARILYHIIRPFLRYLLNLYTLLLIPYHEMLAKVRKRGITTKVEVAKLGVDIDRFRPSKDKVKSKEKVKIGGDKFVIGYVGRISSEKNIDTLREAFMKLENQEDVHLVIVGDGTDNHKKKLLELPNCTVTGFVENVQDYLSAMDVFVMPSLTETTSLATLEAMSSGLPVISSRIGFMKSYLTKGHNGLFFPKNSSSMLAMKIEKLRNDPELRSKLGKKARNMVAYSFSWERSINRIKRLIIQEFNNGGAYTP